jgi:hypothetical protein
MEEKEPQWTSRKTALDDAGAGAYGAATPGMSAAVPCPSGRRLTMMRVRIASCPAGGTTPAALRQKIFLFSHRPALKDRHSCCETPMSAGENGLGRVDITIVYRTARRASPFSCSGTCDTFGPHMRQSVDVIQTESHSHAIASSALACLSLIRTGNVFMRQL